MPDKQERVRTKITKKRDGIVAEFLRVSKFEAVKQVRIRGNVTLLEAAHYVDDYIARRSR